MDLRVCDTSATCGFDVRDSAVADCFSYSETGNRYDPLYYKCAPGNPGAGRPVVQSWARTGEILDLYNGHCDLHLTPLPSFDIDEIHFVSH